MKLPSAPQPITIIQAFITVVVLSGTLWLGLEEVLASEAVASIFTAALGYIYTAGVQERSSGQATDTAVEMARSARRDEAERRES